MKESELYIKKPHNSVQCLICQRKCIIAQNNTGFCLSKLNKKGSLVDLLDGIITHYQIDPVEKKPLYHVFPGSRVLSIGSYGCNYRCKQCLNSHCSWGEPATSILAGLKNNKKSFLTEYQKATPRGVVKTAKENDTPGIAYTYNEPTIWSPFVYKTASLAKKEGLFNVFVTNGSWSKETIDRLAPVIDAANIDLKGFSQKTYNKMGAFFGKILENTVHAQKKGIFIELTTLLIPQINDSHQEIAKLANWIVKKLGAQTPWHLSQFDPSLTPDKEFQKLSVTPVKSLKKTAQIGEKQGLKHIYIWAPHDNFSKENTYCPKCSALLIKRDFWKPTIVELDAQKSVCRQCRQKIPGLWK